MRKNKFTMVKSLLSLLAISIIACSCFNSKEKEVIVKIPTIADVPNITKETKENVTEVRSLSEHYVIKNVKKANKLLEDTKKSLEKAEKKDKKKALKIFVEDYKEIVEFYRDITKDDKVEEVKEELLNYYNETVKFYKDLEIMQENLGHEKDDFFEKLKLFGEAVSREDQLKRTTVEQQLKYTAQQEKMIRDFKTHYGKLIPEIEKVRADVDFFIETLKETAKVYETAYHTAELSMNISNAIDNIQELNALGDLTNDILESWKNLDSILDNLTDISNLVG